FRRVLFRSLIRFSTILGSCPMPGSDEQEFSEMTDPTQTTSEQHDQTGSYVQKGESFQRDMNYIPTRVTSEGEEGYPVEAGRYRLPGARACPWANGAVIDPRLPGLEDALSMATAGPTHDKRSWTFDLDEGGR